MKAMNIGYMIALAVPVIISLGTTKKCECDTETVATVEKLLTRKIWKAEEVRVQLADNTSTYYMRGASDPTYDSDSLKFSQDNTGTYYYDGNEMPMTWKFTNELKTKMTIEIEQYPGPIVVYLENINITRNSFKYAQYFKGPGVPYLASCTRVPN